MRLTKRRFICLGGPGSVMATEPLDARAVAAARVEATVAARLAPTPEFLARVEQVRITLPEKVRAAAEARGSPLVKALVAGSAARGTFLSDRLDIDLFMLFPPELSRDRLKEEGLALGRAVLTNPTTKYAEHPYLRGQFEGFAVDAVPGFAVDDPSQPISPVDRTPFHQQYLSSRESPEHVVQIRLAKQFLRTLGVYGSEARTEGFSGYLLELLILEFGSLRGLLQAARSWRVPVRLAPPGKEPPRLPEDVALVLADPVDPHRNVATALSRRNLGLTILAAREYLERPELAWFEPVATTRLTKEAAVRHVRGRDSHVVVLRFPRPQLVDDTLVPQVRKAERSVAEELARGGFVVLGSASASSGAEVCLLMEVAYGLRPAVQLRGGPPAGIDRVGSFLEKWTAAGAPVLQGPYVQGDGSLAVETRTGVRDVESFLREVLPRLSLGKNLSAPSAGSTVIEPLELATEGPLLQEALQALLDRRLPWLQAPAEEPR